MSAYIVTPEVIQNLVTYLESVTDINELSSWELGVDGAGREELVEALVDETIFSVEYRYKDLRGRSTEAFVHMTREEYLAECQMPGELDVEKLSPYNVLKMFNEYAYQSCEHPGWDHSVAKAIVDQGIKFCKARKEVVK